MLRYVSLIFTATVLSSACFASDTPGLPRLPINISSHSGNFFESLLGGRVWMFNWQGAPAAIHFTRQHRAFGWLNQVERFFALLTEKQIRRGVHRSTQELEQAIRNYIDTVNADPRPFRWTKSADDILATIKRFCLPTLDTAERQREIIKTSESGH